MINFDDPTIAEACTIYGFAATPDPATLSIRQIKIIRDIAAALKKRDARWRGRLAGETLAATKKERARIAAYLDFHEYDITSGVLDPLRALRHELGVKDEP